MLPPKGWTLNLTTGFTRTAYSGDVKPRLGLASRDEFNRILSAMTFDQLMKAGKWVPIRNCPGRYKLVGADPNLSVLDLVGSSSAIYSFQVETARDPVLVAALDEGGIISYQRADGSFVHTLNTPEGFARKLSQLGIAWPPVREQCD